MTLANKVVQFNTDAEIMHAIVHGGPATVVQTGSGPVRSVSKLLQDNQEQINVQAALRASRAQAKDGLTSGATSTPAAVAQQLATTLPPDCRIVQFGMQSFANPGTGVSEDGKKVAADAMYFYPKSATSRLLLVATLDIEVTAPAADTLINTAIEMLYYDGAGFQSFLQAQSVCVGGASSAALRAHGSATFAGELTQAQRRTDSQRQWTIRPYVTSISGASWEVNGGNVMFIEVDEADTTAAADTVEQLVHCLSYGQSLGAGSTSTPAKTLGSVRPGRALMPAAGVRPLGAQSGSSEFIPVTELQLKTLVNLREKTDGNNGETPSSAAAWRLTDNNGLPAHQAVVSSNHSIGGRTIEQLSAGTVPYQNAMAAVRRSRVLARRNGMDHAALLMWYTQGEANHSNSQAAYLAKLLTLQASLTADVRAIDRSTGEFPVFLDQLSNWTSYNVAESEVPFAQLQAALENPGKFYLVGPKYMLATSPDGTHLTNDSSAMLGSYQGEAARRVFGLGQADFKPLHIKTAVRTGNVVVLTYHAPAASFLPLVLDTALVSNPGNYGYRFTQAGGNAVTITSVAITGPAQVTITLSAVPTGAAQTIGYADIGTAGNAGGPTTGPRGNLRDQSTITGLYGEPLYNWACHQRIAVTA